MPYSKKSDAPDWVADDKKMQWVEVWNSVYKAKKKEGMSDKDAEGEAFKQAGGVVSDKKENPMNGIELRFTSELRVMESQGDEMAVGGYAALFNNVSHNLGGFKEKIAPGAFARSLGEGADVKALFNHDPSRILGRTKSGTLVVKEDERGLQWRAVLDPTNSDHKNMFASIKRGDITDCSFAFTVPPGGDDWQEENGNEDWFAMRTLKDVNLMDVSAVTYPAYPGTSVGQRAETTTPEVRMRVDQFKTKRMAGKPGTPEKRDDDSLEEFCREVCAALAAKYPATDADGNVYPNNYGKYWVVETHTEYVIACMANGPGDDYFRIAYHQDGDDNFLFGDPQPVEKEWVPSERCKATATEMRHVLDKLAAEHKAAAAAAQATADAAQADAHAHSDVAAAAEKMANKKREMCAAADGDCMDKECDCQNCESDPADVWEFGDDEPGEENKLRVANRIAEKRAAGGDKVRTKTVGGKALTADKFAFVGDKDKTETWKLPIHDAARVRNALARFNQTEGIPADKKSGVYRKIVAAAHKFGIEVSDEKSVLASLPLSTEEIEDIQRRARAAMVDLAL